MGNLSASRPRGREYWAAVIARFETSGSSHQEFVSREGVSLSAFQKWLYRLRREQQAEVRRPQPAPRFVEVVAAAAPSPKRALCSIHLGDTEVTFSELPCPSYLATLLREASR